MGKTVLEAKELCKTYIVDKYSNNVLRNVDFKLNEGEFTAIMGPSGSGKSTLLYTLSGMDEVTSGSVLFDGKDISIMNHKQLSNLRLNEMGFVFQQMYMLKKLCILDNIILPGYQTSKASKTEVNDRARKLMHNLGIESIAQNEIYEVSGGQLQRACLCRALINSPKILFADEPTGALNSKAATEVMKELRKANSDGMTILMVTHSEKVAASSERVVFLVDGNIKGELYLGKQVDDSDGLVRERKLKNWLDEMGW
ncbi:putative ABC transport system ATP-binding protein [Pseudobutyrivibrio sp. NOR37]|uniref:ABC transporter ATP-binding protein n=1 Tax=Pseudobutyrivibrio xylanivorans TaxID=185007 RepID=A0A6M0LJU8_PSEXY|nr:MULTISPECIES: ABC transporter ATP-binding protein [Pseudobutyrivibrio]NEX02784.1 ABC transporter ATP-binding protein [Pseudobutyrivibrio xylanivorans]SFR81079.1 putative ABC transport system ATP-binding protein [Pseudobutyrivibrio sp. NOR37]